MASKDYYSTLWVDKKATQAEIKKAYKKLALQYHPDRNKNSKSAETKFKEINEAYQTLSDTEKRKQYDQFWSDPMGGFGSWYGGFSQADVGGQGFGGFEDIFSQFQWANTRKRAQSQGFSFNFSDLFWWGYEEPEEPQPRTRRTKEETPQKEENLDVTETVEIPFLDFLFDTSVSVKTVYGKTLSLKVKANTKPWTKFKLTEKGRTSGWKTGDMYVIVNAKMPKSPDQKVLKMIEGIRHSL